MTYACEDLPTGTGIRFRSHLDPSHSKSHLTVIGWYSERQDSNRFTEPSAFPSNTLPFDKHNTDIPFPFPTIFYLFLNKLFAVI
jgi:hypothetical protein